MIQKQWCDCANDLAWLLVNAPGPSVRDIAHGASLAVKATELQPECGTYWNTLGAAYYRAGNFRPPVAALNRAINLGDGGNVFDHVFLGHGACADWAIRSNRDDGSPWRCRKGKETVRVIRS